MPHNMINGCNLFYEEHGTGLQTVIFLHDVFFNRGMFHQQMIALRDRYRCVLVDLRGHGSSVVSSGGFELTAVAKDLSQLIQVKRWGACHFVGTGMGGYVSLVCALQQPSLVSSLTLIGASGEEISETQQRWLKARALHIKLFGPRFGSKKIINRYFSNEYLAYSAHKPQIARWRKEFLKLNRHQIVPALSGLWTRPRLLDSLYKVKQPTLLIAAENDQVTPLVSIHRTENALRNSSIVTLPATGHIANLEKPKVVSDTLLKYFATLK